MAPAAETCDPMYERIVAFFLQKIETKRCKTVTFSAMQAIFESFDLNLNGFCDTFREFAQDITITGSAALAAYVRENTIAGVAPFEPSDIDIFVNARRMPLFGKLLDAFLAGANYRREEAPLRRKYESSRFEVATYTRGGKRLQIVACNGSPFEAISHFDLTACMVWFNIDSRSYGMMHLALTLGGGMMKSGASCDKRRHEKYIARGFHFVE